MEPAQFYTGLVAELYDALKSARVDHEPYARFIAASGEPALELGCGDGEPIVQLRRQGLDVEGLDSSADMLARCRRRAAEAGVDVVVHHQSMESFDLGRTYRSIFLAGPTFDLLPDDDAASRALACIRRHLDDRGSALIPLFIPTPPTTEHIVGWRETTEADGSVIGVGAVAEHRDETTRTQETVLRYVRQPVGDEEPTVVERPWLLHWYTQDGFGRLASAAGLETVAILDAEGQPASSDADTFVFWLRPVRDRSRS